jgi:RHS repeat-associated protein
VGLPCQGNGYVFDSTGSVWAGEQLTVANAVWTDDNAGTLDPVEVSWREFCDGVDYGQVASEEVNAPALPYAPSGATATATYTVTHTCAGAAQQGNYELQVSTTVIGGLGNGGEGGSFYASWGLIPPKQVTDCTCVGDGAAPGAAQGNAGDPVATVSGAYVDSVTDAVLKSPGFPLAVARSYSSADTVGGSLGPGWRLPWESSLAVNSPSAGDVTFTAEDGNQYVYTQGGTAGTFTAPFGAASVLAEVTDSSTNTTYYTLTSPQGEVMWFSASGQLLSHLDATGRGLVFGYNAAGQVSSITDAAGQQVNLTYTGSLLSQMALPNGQDITYGYTGGLLTSVTAPGGSGTTATTNYLYNAGLLASVQDPDGKYAVRNTYNSAGQVTSQEDGAGRFTSFSYTSPGTGLTETDVTDPDGGITSHVYGGGMLIASTDQLGNSTDYVYNSDAEPVTVTDPLGRATQMAYDSAGHLTSETDALGHSRSWTFDSHGNVLSATDPNGHTTNYTYNSMNEVTSSTSPLGGETTDSYDSNGNLTSSVDPRGNVSGANAAAYTTTYAYYPTGQLKSVTDPDGNATSYTYDAMGFPLTVTDPKGYVTTYAYDGAEHTTLATPPGATAGTQYQYDAAGNLTSRTDPDGNTWTYSYDGDNRLTGVKDPLGHSVSYQYDGNGNQTLFTDARAITTATTFDADGRPKTITYSDGTPSVSYSYDADGEITSVTDGTGTRSVAYNGAGQLTTDGGFSYGYDPAGNVTSRTYPDGAQVSYGYDNDGQVSTLTTGSATTTYSYDPAGNLIGTAEPNGVTESRTYDGAGQLKGITDATSSATVDSYGLTLDADGRPTVVAVKQNGAAQATRYYGYDQQGRLTSACYSTTGSSACSSGSAGTVNGTAADPASSTGMVTSGESAMCVDDAGDSGAAGTKIQVWQCLGDANQELTVTAAGQVQVAGGCLAVSGGGTAAGTAVVLEPCTAGNGAETWLAGAGSTLVNPASGLCLDDPGGSVTNGTAIDIAACSGSAQQQWGLPGTAVDWITDGVTGICADDSGGSTTPGAQVVIWTCNGNTAQQKWTVTSAGQWQIHSLCAQATSTATGLVLQSCGSSANQEWASGPTGWVWNVGAKLCLSDLNASTTNGTQIVITGCARNPQQSWRLPPSRINSGVITSGVSGVCAANSAGTKAVTGSCDGDGGQQWAIGNDANVRTLAATPLCWTLNGGATASGTPLALSTCAGNIDQEFAQGPSIAPWITSVDNAAAGLCVTDPGGSTASGTQLQIATCSSGSASQKWPLPPTTAPWTTAGVTVAAGAASAAVSWTPTSNGGDPAGYTVTATPGGQTASVGSYATTATVAGLTPGTAYTFTVTAASAAGTATTGATTAVTPGSQTSYSYDGAGNLTSAQSDGVTTTNSFNAAEQLTKSVTGTATVNYGYDLDGNQTSAGSLTDAYNADNQLITAATPAGTFGYAYGDAGNLAATTLNGAKIQGTVWDLNNPLPSAVEDTSPSGASTADYAYTPGGGLAVTANASGTYYPVQDWLGSLTGLTNSAGGQVTSTSYSSYGTPSTAMLVLGAPVPSIGYAGSYTLPGGTGLDDMRARDYNPATGGFQTVDPALATTGVPYAYAGGSPTAATDIAGLCSSWNLFCEVVQPHWRGIAQGAVDVGTAVGMGVCTVATEGSCALLNPLAWAAAGALNNLIAGPGSQTWSDYSTAISEGLLTGSIGILCPVCVESPLMSGLVISGVGGDLGAWNYFANTACPTLGGYLKGAFWGALGEVGYPVDREYYHAYYASHLEW